MPTSCLPVNTPASRHIMKSHIRYGCMVCRKHYENKGKKGHTTKGGSLANHISKKHKDIEDYDSITYTWGKKVLWSDGQWENQPDYPDDEDLMRTRKVVKEDSNASSLVEADTDVDSSPANTIDQSLDVNIERGVDVLSITGDVSPFPPVIPQMIYDETGLSLVDYQSLRGLYGEAIQYLAYRAFYGAPDEARNRDERIDMINYLIATRTMLASAVEVSADLELRTRE